MVVVVARRPGGGILGECSEAKVVAAHFFSVLNLGGKVGCFQLINFASVQLISCSLAE